MTATVSSIARRSSLQASPIAGLITYTATGASVTCGVHTMTLRRRIPDTAEALSTGPNPRLQSPPAQEQLLPVHGHHVPEARVAD